MAALHLRILWYDKRMLLEGRRDPKVMLLRTIPGVGPVTAPAIVATAGDGHQFRNGRELAAWLGLTPINRSSGGKESLGRISKMGDRYLRRLLVTGMTARLNQMKVNPDRVDPWAMSLRARKSPRVATVAMANKTARIIWAVLTRYERYQPHTGHSFCLQMPFNIHALMENSDDSYHFATGLKIYRMPAYQRFAITRPHQNRAPVAFSFRDVFKHIDDVVGVGFCLLNSPFSRRIDPDIL